MSTKLARTEGFTLTEILVALMVLGVAAGTMSSVMGTAFKSYKRLSDNAKVMTQQTRLTQVMNEVSGRYWLTDGPQKEAVLSSLEISGPYFHTLGVEESENGEWGLYAYTGVSDKVRVLTSMSELRFNALGIRHKLRRASAPVYDYHTLNLERRESDWVVIASIPLKVDENPACRFDIVGRQCR